MDICKSNFDFIYENYDDSITTPLKEAEKAFWTDYVAAGVALRKVLEGWCNRTIEAQGKFVGPKPSLVDKINALYQYYPPQMKEKEYKYIIRGQNEPHNLKIWHYVWRGYGNVCSHDKDLKPDYPSACFENLSIVFSIVYEFFYYDAIGKGYHMPTGTANSLNLSKMPIGKNKILLEKRSPDSLCDYEYITLSCSEAGTIENYGIVRIFEKDKLRRDVQDVAAQTGEYETYIRKIDKLNLPSSCCKSVETLSDMGSAYSDFFIVKYIFDNMPCSLSNDFLKKISLKQKYTLCRDLAAQLNEYHKAGVCHRNLNCTSIALCDDGNGGWKPSIIKLEYAKNTNSSYTVIGRVKNKATINGNLSKYEDRRIAALSPREPTTKDWERADVFSLGVLFRDILTENVSQPQLGTKPLKEVSADVWKLAKDMSSNDYKDRPALSEVVQAFQKEINNN